MKKITLYLVTMLLLSFTTQQFSEKNLIGKWKIIKVENSLGSKIGYSAFKGQTFTYKENYTIFHFNPEHPFLKEETGKWELIKNIIYQYNEGEKKEVFGEILKLNDKEFIVDQTQEKVLTKIYFKKIK